MITTKPATVQSVKKVLRESGARLSEKYSHLTGRSGAAYYVKADSEGFIVRKDWDGTIDVKYNPNNMTDYERMHRAVAKARFDLAEAGFIQRSVIYGGIDSPWRFVVTERTV